MKAHACANACAQMFMADLFSISKAGSNPYTYKLEAFVHQVNGETNYDIYMQQNSTQQ